MIVIDASVVSKLFLPLEKHRQKSKEILRRHLQKLDDIIVPDLLHYEVANALATKTSLPLAKILKDLSRFEIYNFSIEHLTIKDMQEASKLSRKYKVSVYDAAYAVLAREKKCDLITADEKFVEQVKLPFVKSLRNYSKV